MKITALAIGIFILIPLCLWSQPYEITEVDIFSLKKFITPEDLTVYGINLNTSIQEILTRFGIKKEDIEATEGTKPRQKYYFLTIKPGLKIRSTDNKTIDAIIIGKDFKDNLKGKTAELFSLNLRNEFIDYLKECLGNPDANEPIDLMGQEFDKIAYLQGFRFIRIFNRESTDISMEITTREILLEK